MNFCPNCGTRRQNGQAVCSHCGYAYVAEESIATPVKKEKAGLNIGFLIWSIINLYFNNGSGIGFYMGAAALAMTIAASCSEKKKSDEFLKLAKIFNLISSISYGVSCLLIMAFLVVYFVFIIAVVGFATLGAAAVIL